MSSKVWLPVLAAVGISATVGCAGNPKAQTPPARPPVAQRPIQPAPVAQPPADPVATLIATSKKHFEAGERELKLGHLEQARTEFDRAVDVLLESPYGARTDARSRDYRAHA